jgi:glycosyltransferase involved in cell wall biosynthesis
VEIECKQPYSWLHATRSLEEAGRYDVIHNHNGEETMALRHFVSEVPMLTTMHCLITDDTKAIWDRYEGSFNCISWSQRELMPATGGIFAGVAYNGIDVPSFPFQTEKGEHLLFLSRICPEKGPELAVEAARRTGRRLVIAGKVDERDRQFFQDVVAPLIDGDQVIFKGEADGRMKRELYRSAACVLMPITWDEPFGLVMVEAMACGTPVIVFNRGAAPEIVENGETGFLVRDVDEMVESLGRLRTIDPAYCRRRMEQRFDGRVMARRYTEIYESLVGARWLPMQPSSAETRAGMLSPIHAA